MQLKTTSHLRLNLYARMRSWKSVRGMRDIRFIAGSRQIFVNVNRGGVIGSTSCEVNVCTGYIKHNARNTPQSEVPRPCLRSLRFLRPKMRTLEKMSTRFPLQSPLFLLGLFLRRLVEGRSKCCSRACLFCLISPLAIAAAMAQNVTTAQVQSHTEHRLHKQPRLAAPVTVPWWRLSAPRWQISTYVRVYLNAGFLSCLSKHYMITVMSGQLSSSCGEKKILEMMGKNGSVHA